MPIQTSVVFDRDVALKGQALEEGPRFDISAYADLAVDFGVGLVYDSANVGGVTKDSTYAGSSPKVKVPTAISSKFMGVAKRVQKDTLDNPDFLTVVTGTQDVKYQAKEEITVRSRGRIWVYSEEAVSPADPVYLRCVTVSTSYAGNFRKSDGAVSSVAKADLISNARWVSKTAAAGLAELELL
jgi:hypothetical protein